MQLLSERSETDEPCERKLANMVKPVSEPRNTNDKDRRDQVKL